MADWLLKLFSEAARSPYLDPRVMAAGAGTQPTTGNWPDSRQTLDMARGALLGLTTDALGYVPDAVADAMRPFGYNVPREQVVGGSDWLASKFSNPSGSHEELAARILSGVTSPDPASIMLMGTLMPKLIRGTRAADDLSRVQFPDIEKPKDLTRKSSSIKGNVVGAPDWVKTPQHETDAINKYLDLVEYGAPAGAWYDEVAKDLFEMSGRRPGVADRLTGSVGLTAANTNLQTNWQGGVRGYNQALTGRPVKTHMPDVNAKIEAIFQGLIERMGPKIGTYHGHLRAAYEPKVNRGVHDIWDLRAWGYPEKMQYPGEAQHRWMDKATDAAVKEANARAIGGKTDWNHDSLQAAAWTAQKAQELNINPAELAGGYRQFYKDTLGTLSVETRPSGELIQPEMDEAQAKRFHAIMERAFSTPGGHDLLAEQLGMISQGPKYIGVGVWGDQQNPVTRIPLATGNAHGARTMDEASRELIETAGAGRGLIGGQADVGYDKLRAAAKVADINAAQIDLGKMPGPRDMREIKTMLEARLEQPGSIVVTNHGRTGLNILYKPDTDAGQVPKSGKELKALFSETLNSPEMMQDSGALISWSSSYKPSAWVNVLNRNPILRQRFEAVAPALATKVEKVLKDAGGKWDPIWTRTLEALRVGNLSEVERRVKQGVLPAVAVAVITDWLQTQSQGQTGTGA